MQQFEVLKLILLPIVCIYKFLKEFEIFIRLIYVEDNKMLLVYVLTH